MRIRSHLLLLTAVVLVPGFLAASVAVTKVRESEREAALSGLRETVRATALIVDAEVQGSLGALTALAQSRSLQTGDFAALYEQAQAIDHKPDVWTLVLDATGSQIIDTSVPFGTPPPLASLALERVSKVLVGRQPAMSDLIIGPVAKSLLTTLYVAAKPGPAGNFVVAQAFSVDHWNRQVTRPQGRPDWIVAVIDRAGKFIWRSHGAETYLGRDARPELVAAAAASHSGLIRHATLEGIDSYDAFTHSEHTGWTIAVAAPVPTIEASATKAVAWLTAGVAVALAVALLAATLLSRTLLNALNAASDAARALGRGEPPQPPRTSVLEVNALNQALHDAARLLTQEKHARGLVEQECEQLLDNERVARAVAQDENVAKDRFLALLGHELRNPLAAISGASEVLARGPQDAPTQQRFVAVIQRQNRQLKRIVDDLLEVSRMLSDKIALDARPLDLAGCVLSGIESLRATERAGNYRWQVHTEPVWVCGDAVRLEQIINNLVVNAMQFSAPDGEIQVTVSAQTNHAVLAVHDAGAGIAPELQARIFEPFVQGPPVAGRPSSGLGIGLSLVRQLVQLHGGEISVRSSGAGDGSTFIVRLPRVAAPHTVPADETPADASAPGSVAAAQVLLVDDNIDARKATAALMRSLGYEVAEAGDADEALESAGAHPPDIIVMDLGLPGKTGFQVAVEIKSLPSMRNIPLIALSGYGGEPDRAAALAAGFDAHLVKPVNLAELARSIEAQLTLRRHRR